MITASGHQYEEFFGWDKQVAEREYPAFVASLTYPTVAADAPWLLQAAADEKKDNFLWVPLLTNIPNWERGAQGIGDCVSWGEELTCTMLAHIIAFINGSPLNIQFATEPIYGGSRVEARGGRLGGWGDGSYAGAAAKFTREWGCLVRQDYSKETGNPEHDLTKYSAQKAKSWGNYGCGGQKDDPKGGGKLDGIAKMMPVKENTTCKTIAEVTACLQNNMPVAFAGSGSFNMKRDSNGIGRLSGWNWAHEMMLGGIRWRANAPEYRMFQSWGHSASGPDPGIVHPAVSKCSWWVTADDFERYMRNGGEVIGHSRLEGLQIDPVSTWMDTYSSWN